jgi:hypothetical protein
MDCPIRAAWLLHLRIGMNSGTGIAKTLSVVALGVAMTIGASCMRAPATIQELTYPPDFSYIPQERIQSSMWILAAEVRRLDELLRATPDGANLAVQRKIQSSLRRMAAAVEQIDHPGRATQHPALNRHLNRFAERIAGAQRGADRTPPNYFQASSLSGSCFLCHGSVDDAKTP